MGTIGPTPGDTGPMAAKKSKVAPRQPTRAKLPKPPKRYGEFVRRFPGLAHAWDALNEAGADGPLDARTRRLLKIAIAMGAMREGAVRSGARKARAEGITLEEIEQLVPLAAATIGLPAAVACWSWVLEALDPK
jgi:4-carboxymuconolactone decarboxylase